MDKPALLKNMSEAAKERVIALGTQFNTIEHEVPSLEDSPVVTFEAGSPKKSFWKRNTSKLPGRYCRFLFERHRQFLKPLC